MTSKDYYNQMLEIAKQKRLLENKKDAYVSYVKKLRTLLNSLPSVQTNLKSAENAFTQGGYLSSGETLSKGELIKHSNTISDSHDNLNLIISKTNYIIETLTTDIATLSDKYKIAEKAYHSAILTEESN